MARIETQIQHRGGIQGVLLPQQHAGTGAIRQKKPQPRTVGVLLLVEVGGIEPPSEDAPCPALHA